MSKLVTPYQLIHRHLAVATNLCAVWKTKKGRLIYVEKNKSKKGKSQALFHVKRRLSRRVDQGVQKSRMWEKEENKIPGHERVESGNADS